ncbi:hypothetical protein MmiAt1_12060 [Methanimicrococcus sp. At1]|uniref:DUF4178 domain-containing protein n=1 Tax=Methanimicrococcus hacksteinii TaxID=3028293 RepID=A0ABU3VQC5_9EURY|nr:hypothetical protein [Methanimicrococcus sp. At1]MDV0445617.1 hypothetical protein [Methanimicrococcus sp. At1]
MGLFSKLFGSNKYNAEEPQGHLKTKRYKRLDWEISDSEYTKQDYIASTEYVIPSHQTITEVFEKLDNGAVLTVNDVFFRADYMGHGRDWYKQRDYMFKELTLRKKGEGEPCEQSCASEADESPESDSEVKKPESPKDVYVLEGKGTFLKEDFSGVVLESETNDVDIRAEVTYKNNRLDIRECSGFDNTDDWYAFMFFFKMLEYYKYPTETCKTIEVEIEEE